MCFSGVSKHIKQTYSTALCIVTQMQVPINSLGLIFKKAESRLRPYELPRQGIAKSSSGKWVLELEFEM